MKQRIITALILIAIVVPIAILGGNLFRLLIAIILGCALYELLKIIRKPKWSIVLDLLVYAYGYYVVFLDTSRFFMNSIVFMLFAVVLFTLSLFFDCLDNGKVNFLLGFVSFVCIGLHCILNIRLTYGLPSILFIALATYGSDTGAYFAGVKFGKHKLIERLSPKKTIEGSIGGVLFGTLIASVYVYFYPIDLSFAYCVVLAFILTFTAQVGDLTFSSVKRFYGIKDFSNLLPGHGGILDRIDSLLFNSVVFALFLSIVAYLF